MHVRVSVVALALFALVSGACDDPSAPATPTAAESVTRPSATVPGPSATATPASPAASGTTFEIAVAGGEVTGGGRQRVEVGDRVRLVITADVSDHVHVHVYDLLEDVSPGQPVEIEFVADIPGVVEVELEDAQLTLLELEIHG